MTWFWVLPTRSFRWMFSHDTRYSMRSAAFRCFLQESFSKIAVTFQEKTHTFFGLFWKVDITQWKVIALRRCKIFGKVAWESSKWSFCCSWHVTISNNNTNAKYVLNREEFIYVICTNPQNLWKNLNGQLERKIPLPKGVSLWCFTHFETAEMVKTWGGFHKRNTSGGHKACD